MKYADTPKFFTWDVKKLTWKYRKNSSNTLGRMYNIHFSRKETFYTKLLLSVKVLPSSFEDLRSHDGVTYNSAYECAVAMGLTRSDSEWVMALEDAFATNLDFMLPF